MKFTEVVFIEEKRKQIIAWQETLEAYSEAKFYRGGSSLTIKVNDELQPLLREVACKWVACKMIKLLDECAHMGVDVSESREALDKLLEGLQRPDAGE